jgi:hypothetical protein
MVILRHAQQTSPLLRRRISAVSYHQLLPAHAVAGASTPSRLIAGGFGAGAPPAYHFVVVGYVVMPEHIHLLIGEPERELRENSVELSANPLGADAIGSSETAKSCRNPHRWCITG